MSMFGLTSPLWWPVGALGFVVALLLGRPHAMVVAEATGLAGTAMFILTVLHYALRQHYGLRWARVRPFRGVIAWLQRWGFIRWILTRGWKGQFVAMILLAAVPFGPWFGLLVLNREYERRSSPLSLAIWRVSYVASNTAAYQIGCAFPVSYIAGLTVIATVVCSLSCAEDRAAIRHRLVMLYALGVRGCTILLRIQAAEIRLQSSQVVRQGARFVWRRPDRVVWSIIDFFRRPMAQEG